jgi:hypothetical protein
MPSFALDSCCTLLVVTIARISYTHVLGLEPRVTMSLYAGHNVNFLVGLQSLPTILLTSVCRSLYSSQTSLDRFGLRIFDLMLWDFVHKKPGQPRGEDPADGSDPKPFARGFHKCTTRD